MGRKDDKNQRDQGDWPIVRAAGAQGSGHHGGCLADTKILLALLC